MTPLPLAKYAADLASLPGDAALGYRNDGVRGVWEAVATRTVHRLIRASRLTVFAQTLERIPEVPPPLGVSIARLRADEVQALAPIAAERDRERFRRLLEIGCIQVEAKRAGAV